MAPLAVRPATNRDNPLWSSVLDLIDSGYVRFNGKTLYPQTGYKDLFRESVIRYSPHVSHPETVDAVLKMIAGRAIITAHAGNAYWAWLLAEAGIDVTCYGIKRSVLNRERTWLEHNGRIVHRVSSTALYTEIRSYDQRTLLLIPQPKREREAGRLLAAHNGPRVIYMGQFPPNPGILKDALDLWEPVDKHNPVIWMQAPFEVVHLKRASYKAEAETTEEGVRGWPTQLLRTVPSLSPRV